MCADSVCTAFTGAGRGGAYARVAWFAEDRSPGPGEVVAPGASLVELGGSWVIRPFWTMRGQVRNLLDQRYYASPDPRFVLAPGRSFILTANLQF